MKNLIGLVVGIAIIYLGVTYIQARDPKTFIEGYKDCSDPGCIAIILRAWQADEVYTSVISDEDRVNSKGKELNNLTGFLIQDRANFHRFDKIDEDDDPDEIFTTPEARSRMPAMINAGYLDPDVESKSRTKNRTVGVRVFVFGDQIVATEDRSFEAKKRKEIIYAALKAVNEERRKEREARSTTPTTDRETQANRPTAQPSSTQSITLISSSPRDFHYRHSYNGEIVGVSSDYRKVIKIVPGRGHAVLYKETRADYRLKNAVLLASGSVLVSVEIAGCSTCHGLLKLDGNQPTWILNGPAPNPKGVFEKQHADNQSIQRLAPSGDGSALIKYIRHAAPNSHQSQTTRHIDLIHHSGDIIKLFKNRSLDLGVEGDILVSKSGGRAHSHWVVQGRKAVHFYDDQRGNQLYRPEFHAGSVLYTNEGGELLFFDGQRNHQLGLAKSFSEKALDPTGQAVALARTISNPTPGSECSRVCYLIERYSNGQNQIVAQENTSMNGFLIANGNIYYSMNRGITGYQGNKKHYFKGYPALPEIPLKNGQIILERERGVYPKPVGF